MFCWLPTFELAWVTTFAGGHQGGIWFDFQSESLFDLEFALPGEEEFAVALRFQQMFDWCTGGE